MCWAVEVVSTQELHKSLASGLLLVSLGVYTLCLTREENNVLSYIASTYPFAWASLFWNFTQVVWVRMGQVMLL
jgi:hypothetical protein